MIPYASPIRFYSDTESIDYVNNFPNYDMMHPNVDYQRGIYPINYFPDFARTGYLRIQIIGEVTYAFMSTQTEIVQFGVIEDVTPAGWVGDPVYLVTYRMSEIFRPEYVGEFYTRITTTSEVIVSDVFLVKEWDKTKDLVKIEYADSLNRNQGVYYDGTTKIWSPEVYYTGTIRPASPDISRQLYRDEPNNTRNLRSTPQLRDSLEITDIHASYIPNVTYQLMCDELIINGISYTAEELNFEPTDKTDIVNATATLSRNNNTGFQVIS